jgi:glycolate oxidase FAD binding subunit
MGKLMIGSFGTLAVITSANFRVHSLPPATTTFLSSFGDLDSAIALRDQIVRSVLQPMAIDLLSPPAATRIGRRGYLVAIRAGGNRAVLARYARELPRSEQLSGEEETSFWRQVREFPADFLRRQTQGVVLRISTTLKDLGPLLKLASAPCVARAGSGVTYVHLTSWQALSPLWDAAGQRGWSAVVEFAPDHIRATKELWASPSSSARANAFAIMEGVKHMFDPGKLLNRSRLYGRI